MEGRATKLQKLHDVGHESICRVVTVLLHVREMSGARLP